jgi:hypothetical protein
VHRKQPSAPAGHDLEASQACILHSLLSGLWSFLAALGKVEGDGWPREKQSILSIRKLTFLFPLIGEK